jgi:hypothetical protein
MAALSDLEQVLSRFGTSIMPLGSSWWAPSLVLLLISMKIQWLWSFKHVAVAKATRYRVKHLSGGCYRFEVSSKAVGFWLYHLISGRTFSIHFSLWRNGGPNWAQEYHLWLDEQDSEWTPVIRRCSYASSSSSWATFGSVIERQIFNDLIIPRIIIWTSLMI